MAAGVDLEKRRFLKGRLAPRTRVVRPPWSRETTIATACTGCGACVRACPQEIIQLDAQGLPAIDFSAGECIFCGNCATACREPVFDQAAPSAFLHVATIGAACFAARGIVCQSCGDACPESAIRFRLRVGAPPLPALLAELCTGCGACIAACPADAIRTEPSVAEIDHA
jgi:ferredoxin-type protein NapF